MPKQPNIVFLMTDHTRAQALRSGECLTPNLDALGTEGLRFERVYTTNAICSPARASLMTGQYASTHGVWDCTHTQRPEWVDVHNDPVFWAMLLQEVGYENAYFGKWHVEQSKKLERFGFPTYDDRCGGYRRKPIDHPQVVAKTPGYKDTLMAGVNAEESGPASHPAFDKGIEFIRAHAGPERPFCCFISTTEPHDPYVPPKRFFEMYDPDALNLSPTLHDDLQGKPEVIKRMASLWKDLTEDDWRLITAAYYATITFLDHEVGRVVETLKTTGIYDDTIIVFTSDHGDMLGGHGLFAKGITPYEEVYNIPLIVRTPGATGGTNPTHLVSLLDVGPTLLDLCGAPELPNVHGRSFRNVLEGSGNVDNWQEAYAEFYGQRFLYTQRLVWYGDWKYIFSPGGIDELYNLAEDPHEEHNLADDPAHHDRLVDMVKRMWRRMEEIGDESLFNTHYKTLRLAPIGPLGK